MAVKIFCNSCQLFIKNAGPNEFKTLTGREICTACKTKVKNAFDSVEAASRRGIVQIETLRDKVKAELEAMSKKVIKADDE